MKTLQGVFGLSELAVGSSVYSSERAMRGLGREGAKLVSAIALIN